MVQRGGRGGRGRGEGRRGRGGRAPGPHGRGHGKGGRAPGPARADIPARDVLGESHSTLIPPDEAGETDGSENGDDLFDDVVDPDSLGKALEEWDEANREGERNDKGKGRGGGGGDREDRAEPRGPAHLRHSISELVVHGRLIGFYANCNQHQNPTDIGAVCCRKQILFGMGASRVTYEEARRLAKQWILEGYNEEIFTADNPRSLHLAVNPRTLDFCSEEMLDETVATL